ncbi:MAG: peptidoglycan D,D-transpeptidase FtsI family protein [Faecousia sp.]
MERISRFRAGLFLGLFAFILLLFSMKLFKLQIIETKGDTDNTQVYSTITTVRAARGDILDRNGNVLVGNRASYNLVFNHYVTKSNPNCNEALYNLVQKCKELGITYTDHFPVSANRPFVYTLTEFNTSWQNYFQLFMVDRGLDSDITAPLLVEKMRTRYEIPDEWSDEDARAVIGFRYEFDLRGITNLPTYTFLEDVTDQQLSAILELNTPGLNVEASTVREYHTKYAAHILGYLGGMNSDQWEEYKKQDYSMDAKVGQTGFELAFEEYLHGIDGTRYDEVNKDGATTKSYYTKEPVAGNSVETTIDIKIQEVAEKALEDVMLNITNPEINKATGDNTGLDAEGAAVIVMECQTGKILACASYPTFNLATMYEDWAEIEANPLKPFFNRAFGAEYPPGSTFKMCTLISAMEHRNKYGEFILPYGTTIVDKGVYDVYEGFYPTCLAWTSGHFTHGELDGSMALCYSCNYFFYQLGDLNNEQNMVETCEDLGLGVPTGIELVEKTGRMNTSEVKRQIYGSGVNGNFSAGDRILGAIGQGENRFTPLQLCVYASTLANKGTRMKATFLSRVVSSDYRTLIKENQPEIANQIEMASTTIETYWNGMRYVVTKPGGTADAYFGGPDDLYPDRWALSDEVVVYAKTGTAEHASLGSDHGAFICFAHRKGETQPDIALAIYGEKAAHGSSLAPVAEQILLAYYEMDAASEVTAFENQTG